MILSSLTAETNLYGPVPTGLASKDFSWSEPTGKLVSALGTTFTTEMRGPKPGKAYFRANSTVLASSALTSWMNGMNCENSDLLAGSITRVKENTTSSAVTGEPLWNTAPSLMATW